MTEFLNDKQQLLLEFVMECHGDQKRKYTNEPYWTHPLEVAKIVKDIEGDNLVEIALLHDVLEDTPQEAKNINDALLSFGYTKLEANGIEMGVVALTDTYTHERFDHFNRKIRKEFEAHRLGKIYKDFQTVKYADLMHNTESIVKHDRNFAKKYLEEKRSLLNLMRNGDLGLFLECCKQLNEAELLINDLNK